MTALAEGTVFSNRYRILRCIGQGGMDAVYEVAHLETERHCALKVMHPHVLHNEDMRNRFRQEASSSPRKSSITKNGMPVASSIPSSSTSTICSLSTWAATFGKKLAACGRFALQDVVTYLQQTAIALDKSHKARVVHRDLKSENLFLTVREDGRPHVKVLDFGIAKFLVDDNRAANATRSIGTPQYMTPEQFRPGGTVSPQTDIYALGMIAYALLIGQPYWAEESRDNANVFAFAAVAMHGPKEAATQRGLVCDNEKCTTPSDALGGACVPQLTTCALGLKCDNGKCANDSDAGKRDQQCRSDRTCESGLVCGTNNLCESVTSPPCGADGETCCDGTACDTGLFCNGQNRCAPLTLSCSGTTRTCLDTNILLACTSGHWTLSRCETGCFNGACRPVPICGGTPCRPPRRCIRGRCALPLDNCDGVVCKSPARCVLGRCIGGN